MVVFLGSDVPLILRKQAGGFVRQLVGYCYLHGFMNGEALLGKLEAPWSAYAPSRGNNHIRSPRFYKETPEGTMEQVWEDPRLANIPVPSPFELMRITQQAGTGTHLFLRFKNTETGQISDCDPRLSAESLRERGVSVEDIILE